MGGGSSVAKGRSKKKASAQQNPSVKELKQPKAERETKTVPNVKQTSKPNPKIEKELVASSKDDDRQSKPVAKFEEEIKAEPKNDREFKTEPKVEQELKAVTKFDGQSKPDPAVEDELNREPKGDREFKNDTKVDKEIHSETTVEEELKPAPPKVQQKLKSDPKNEPELKHEAKVEQKFKNNEINVDQELKSEPKMDQELDSEPRHEAESKPEPTAKQKFNPEPESEQKSKATDCDVTFDPPLTPDIVADISPSDKVATAESNSREDELANSWDDSDENSTSFSKSLPALTSALPTKADTGNIPRTIVKGKPYLVAEGCVDDGGEGVSAVMLACHACGFDVLRFPGYRWGAVDYFHFRNFAPDRRCSLQVQRKALVTLQTKLVPDDLACAYSCSCSWQSVLSWKLLDKWGVPPAPEGGTGQDHGELRWMLRS